VFFWLNETASVAERESFEIELDKLTRDAEVLERRGGKPASTNRDVIDSSYDYGISLCFTDLAAHDRYQAGQVHLDFLEKCLPLWKRVQVYDMNDIFST
jgi:hypothetical protein